MIQAGAGGGGVVLPDIPFTVALTAEARDSDDSREKTLVLIGPSSAAIKQIEVPGLAPPVATLSVFGGETTGCWYPDDHQVIDLRVNGVTVQSFDSCSWAAVSAWHEFVVPGAFLHSGQNEVRLVQTTGEWSWWSLRLGVDTNNNHGHSAGNEATLCPLGGGCSGVDSTIAGELMWTLAWVAPHLE